MGDDGGVREAESWATSPASRAVMRANRRRDTRPELAVRRLVHAAGLRYRVDARPLPTLNRKADLVFTRTQVAVFIDGCYWHGCPEHGTRPKANADYWAGKIAGNVARDADTDRRLAQAGWTVLRFWEHQSPVSVAIEIAALVSPPPNPSKPTNAAHPAEAEASADSGSVTRASGSSPVEQPK